MIDCSNTLFTCKVLLDMLFTRLQNQAEAFTELSQRVGRLEVRDLDKEEMLRRVQFCEEKLSELTASKLSPFKQQEIMARIEALEKSPVAPANGLAAESRDIAQQGSYLPTSPAPRPPSSRPVPPSLVSVTAPTNYFDSSSTQPPVSSAPVMIAMEIPAEYEQRLAAVEDKLRGVYNLSGKLISLEAMAEKMGTAIPDLDYNPTLISNLPKPRPETYIPLPDTISAPHSSPEAPSSALASELNIAIRKVARENEELAIALGVVKTEILKNKAEQEEGDAKLSKRIDGIQSQSLESERRLTSDLVAVRTLAKKEPEVSFADIEVIKSKIDAAAKEGRDAHEAVSALKSKEIKALNDSLLELKDSKKDGGGSAGMREMDTLFHNRSMSTCHYVIPPCSDLTLSLSLS